MFFQILSNDTSVVIKESDYMKNKNIRIARSMLIEKILQSNIKREDKIELAIQIHHLLQEEVYKDNVKALKKVRRYYAEGKKNN